MRVRFCTDCSSGEPGALRCAGVRIIDGVPGDSKEGIANKRRRLLLVQTLRQPPPLLVEAVVIRRAQADTGVDPMMTRVGVRREEAGERRSGKKP